MTEELFDPVIDVAGTPKEMGLQHGRQLRDRIHHTAAMMREQVGAEPYEASWEAFQPTLAYCRDAAPDMVEEMEGIAEGAEIGLADILAINAHLDLMIWRRLVWEAGDEGGSEACSSHAVVTDSEVLLAWNGDDRRVWLGCGIIVRGRPEGGEPFAYWSLAGTVGRPGLGRHVAVGANSIAAHQWRAEGLLYPMVCRKLLPCKTTEECLEVFDRYDRCAAMNYMVADSAGSLADIESTPYEHVVLRPEGEGVGSYVLHTNSTLAPSLGGTEDPGCSRLEAARRLYAEGPPGDVESARAVQRDHTGGVCVHTPESCTLVSFVAEVRAGRLDIVRANPCKAPAQTLTLDG